MFIVGHSHIAAIEQAAAGLGVSYRSLNLWGFGRPVVYGDGPPRLEPKLEAMLGPYVISTVGGSAHDMVGLVQHPDPFDFVLPERPELPLIPGAQVLAYDAVRRTVEAMMEGEQLDLVRLLPGNGRRVLHLESPPPTGDDPRMAEEMGMLAFVPKPNLGPSPRWLRYKLWRVHSAIVREACKAAGVTFVPCPLAAFVDGDFMRLELYERPCHANRDYGDLVMRQLGFAA